MIYAIGDSHVLYVFRGLPEVDIRYLAGLTIQRVGYMADDTIRKEIEKINPTNGDVLIFSFGEIDVRTVLHPILEHRSTVNLYSILSAWVDRYCDCLKSLQVNGAKICALSVMPPITSNQLKATEWFLNGSDKERAKYTIAINDILRQACIRNGWLFIDIYSLYADADGMLPVNMSDGTVHIGTNWLVTDELKKMGIMS